MIFRLFNMAIEMKVFGPKSITRETFAMICEEWVNTGVTVRYLSLKYGIREASLAFMLSKYYLGTKHGKRQKNNINLPSKINEPNGTN